MGSVLLMNHATARQAGFHQQHSMGAPPPIELSIETLSRVHTRTSSARGSKGPLCSIYVCQGYVREGLAAHEEECRRRLLGVKRKVLCAL